MSNIAGKAVVAGLNQKGNSNDISNLVIVDMGILERRYTTENGVFGVFRSNRSGLNGMIKYDNVEMISIGNSNGGLQIDNAGGDLYLLFSTRTSLISTISKKIDVNSKRIYSIAGMKGIPISSMLTNSGSFRVGPDGSVSLRSAEAHLTLSVDNALSYRLHGKSSFLFSKEGDFITSLQEGKLFLKVCVDGSRYMVKYLDDKISEFNYYDVDGNYTQAKHANVVLEKGESLFDFDNYKYKDVWNADGSRLTVYKDADGNILREITISSDGVYTETGKGNLTIVNDGDISADAKSGKIEVKNTEQSLGALLDSFIAALKDAEVAVNLQTTPCANGTPATVLGTCPLTPGTISTCTQLAADFKALLK